MSYLKLRELWTECEKMKPELLRVFVEGLLEMAQDRYDATTGRREEPAKPCVAKPARIVNNHGRWSPQEDDLLHKCITESYNPHQGYVAFANDPANLKRRTKEAAQQRYYALVNEGKW